MGKTSRGVVEGRGTASRPVPAAEPLITSEKCARLRPRAGARGSSAASREVQMITKIVVRPYKKAPDQLEADV
ncbi:MAG: hypothetical protein K1X67_17065, partial [Fimbriimonadaceae bacterium]|nr:hypothetical protein [Fimbriimonadaceae bacterium]